jgi:hypothetical protein
VRFAVGIDAIATGDSREPGRALLIGDRSTPARTRSGLRAGHRRRSAALLCFLFLFRTTESEERKARRQDEASADHGRGCSPRPCRRDKPAAAAVSNRCGRRSYLAPTPQRLHSVALLTGRRLAYMPINLNAYNKIESEPVGTYLAVRSAFSCFCNLTKLPDAAGVPAEASLSSSWWWWC